jgi:hypothetical protein
MQQSDQLGQKMETFFVPFSHEFVITVIFKTEFDCNSIFSQYKWIVL